MNLGDLRILLVLVLAFPLSSYAQSLGDVARELRAERRQSVTSHPKVITNDDIESRRPAPAPGKHEAGKEGEETAETANSAEGAKKEGESAGESKHAKSSGKAVPDPAKQEEARELRTEKRGEEINKIYRDRIAGIRAQIVTAQQELDRLLVDQIESTNQFQRSYGTAPSVTAYEAQQRVFNEQIETHRNLIPSLNSQLEDAQEAARHAGVPHASD
jgi:uncharacterized protein YukE